MKNLLVILALFASFTAFSQSGKKETITIVTKNNCNHCKVCETCGQKLETDLYFVRGVKLVTYNEAEMTTTIVYKPKQITPAKIREEIAKLGFDADDVKADPAAYAKRDTCCTGE